MDVGADLYSLRKMENGNADAAPAEIISSSTQNSRDTGSMKPSEEDPHVEENMPNGEGGVRC